MSTSKSRQFIENTLIAIKRDLVVLSVKNPKITEEIQVLIQRTEQYLNNIIDMVDSVYDSVPAGHDQVLMLYNYLLEILFEDFDQLKIVKIIESDEDEEIISSFRNHFVELIREIENEL